MQKTKIDWCDMSWNPITGCLHDCEYCYARSMSRRFAAFEIDGVWFRGKGCEDGGSHELEVRCEISAYPYGFDPTFHRYRLDEPARIKKPQTIFVGSMADIFGDWVPDEWIERVFKACSATPQHRYLFLTKNPKRYLRLPQWAAHADNMFFGATVTTTEGAIETATMLEKAAVDDGLIDGYFLSIEPMQEDIFAVGDDYILSSASWIIVGAETGNRKGKITPKREWIENLRRFYRDWGPINQQGGYIPIFEKSSLAPIMGELIQQYPWEV